MSNGIFSFAGTSGSGGDIPDIIKVSVEARAINRMDYDGETNVPVEITTTFRAVFDLEQLETGWARFSDTGPTFVMARIGDPVPPQPSEDFKPGYKVRIKLARECADPKKGGGDVREFSTNSRYLRDSMSELYTLYKSGEQPGKLPVVSLREWKKEVTVSKKFPSKTFYRPIWQIDAWVGRPVDMPLTKGGGFVDRGDGVEKRTVPNGGGVTPPSTGSTVVPPPAAKQPEPAMASVDDDFG